VGVQRHQLTGEAAEDLRVRCALQAAEIEKLKEENARLKKLNDDTRRALEIATAAYVKEIITGGSNERENKPP
jgi:CRISPR/Cas system-associated endoribonuclease Cas2